MKQSRLLLLLVGLFFSFISLSAQAVWDGTVATSFAGGTGTQYDPYLISDGAELAYLAKITNENPASTSGKYYQLAEDIILNVDVLDENYNLIGTPANPWTPIANVTGKSMGDSFKGDFDGDGHVISGVYCVNTSGNYPYTGLFGSIGNEAVIHDLAVVDSYSECIYTCGIITANMTNTSVVRRCYADGRLAGRGSYAGHIVGTMTNGMSCLVEYCYSKGVNTCTFNAGGGIAGYTSSNNSVRYCFTLVDVQLTNTGGQRGGVIGQDNGHGEFTHLYFDQTISPDLSVGYQNTYENCSGKTTEEMQAEEFAQLLGAPFEYVAGNYPRVECLPAVGESGADRPGYRIAKGELSNHKGCAVGFYTAFDGTDVSKRIVRAEGGSTVFVKVTVANRRILSAKGVTLVNSATGQTVALTPVVDDIWSFTMPEGDIVYSASFLMDDAASAVWDGSVATAFAGGTGTQDDPYLISDGAELAYLSRITKIDAAQTAGKYYKLTTNILLNENVLTEDFLLNGTPDNIWIPIGDAETPGDYDASATFQGYFDGNSYAVSGIYCPSEYGIAGLFGAISGGEIHDLSVVDSYVKASRYAGAVAGGTTGYGQINRCYGEGYIVAEGDYCFSGSVVGHVDAGCTLNHCYGSGRSVSSSYAGGIVGWINRGSTYNSFSANIKANEGAYGGTYSGSASTLYYDKTLNPVSGNGTAKTTAEMKSAAFAELLGEPFEWSEDNYPYVGNLLKVGDKIYCSASGYRVVRGTLVNGKGCSARFYSTFDGVDVKKSTSRAEPGTTVYVKVTMAPHMVLSDAGIVVTNDSNGEQVRASQVADGIWAFSMPASDVTVSATFLRDPSLPPVWDGSVADEFERGKGTKESPYLIRSGAELAYLASITNANGDLTKDKYYQLTEDIYLNDDVLNDAFECNGLPENVWEPIGYDQSHQFQGHFDGNHHLISGLYAHKDSYVGLFGWASGSTICNVSLVDSYVKGYYAGALAYATGYSDSTYVRNCYVEAGVEGIYYSSAMIVQLYDMSVMENCYASGRILRGDRQSGLVSTQNSGSIMRNCYSAVRDGQAVAYMGDRERITNVYSDGDLASVAQVREDLCGKHTIEMQTENFAERMGAPFEYVLGNYPYIPGLLKIGENRGWKTPADPAHGGAGSVWDGETSIIFASGTGTEKDPYMINNGSQLAYLAALTNANPALTKDKYYKLGADIILNENVLDNSLQLNGVPENVWEPIGNDYNCCFQGHFDGDYHKISGLYANKNSYVGLFGYTSGSTICNLSLIDSYVAGYYVGALASATAYNDSTYVRNCYVEAVLNGIYQSAMLVAMLNEQSVMENCYASGRILRGDYKAGLVVYQYSGSQMRHCFSTVENADAVGSVGDRNSLIHVYCDRNLGSKFYMTEEACSKQTIELQTQDFAKMLGAPYEFVLGNYPYIPGLMKIGENRGWKTPADPAHGGAGGVWDGETSITFASGTGTEADPYIINNGAQLSYLAKLTNANHALTNGRYYRLEADIQLNDQVLTEDGQLNGEPANTWEPIGIDEAHNFNGHFDGNNYTISGVYINNASLSAPSGLFGCTGEATISNLTLLDSYVYCYYVGALVGQAGDGTSVTVISRCYSGATVRYHQAASVMVNRLQENSVMEYCYSNGLEEDGRDAASLVYNQYGIVRKCYSVSRNMRAIGYMGNRDLLTDVYYDRERAGDRQAAYFTDGYRSAETSEMTSVEFARQMGKPYIYEAGYYPYVDGLPKIDKNGNTILMKGYTLRLGTLVNGNDCDVKFYRGYDDEDGALDRPVVSGSKVFTDGSAKVYAQVISGTMKHLDENGLVVSAATGETAEVTQVADGLYMFTMPENITTVSARFFVGGYCGNPEVHDGHDVQWQLDDSGKTMNVSGHGEIVAGSWDAYTGSTLTVYLPAEVTTIQAGTFAGVINKLQHVYCPVPEGQTLYANDQQVPDADGLGDVKDFGITQNQAVHLAWYTGYNVNIGTIAGVSCGLKVFANDALTTEIPNGYKAIRMNDETKVYVKAQPGTTSILFKNGLTVKAGSSTLAVTQEGDEVFSFIMPKSAVTISAQFTKGGYSGKGDVNSGHNLIWTLVDGRLAFQKNPMAQGSNLDMGDFTATGAPWNGSEVTALDLGDATSIGSGAFASCTALVGIELNNAPMAIGSNAFAKSTWIIVPVATYSVYQTEWAAYSDQIVKDKETLSMNEGQQWTTFYSKVGRVLPTGLHAYTVKSINGNMVMTGTAIDYVPANEAVLIEHSDKSALTAEATTSIAPYSTADPTPVCKMTTEQSNLLQWLTAPKSVNVGDGYTLYKDEFVMVSSGTLPAGITFLPESSAINAPRLFIYTTETTGIDASLVNSEEVNNEGWYDLEGRKLSGKPDKKGLYIHNGRKVVIK